MDYIYNSYIISFVANHCVDLLIIIVACVFLFVFAKEVFTSNDGRIRKIVNSLVVEAEKFLGSSTGQIKKKQVISWFYTKHPTLSLFVSEDTLSKMIDAAVKDLNYYLSKENADLLSLSEEQERDQKAVG